jgi:NAD-dependent dihydropyrimidine dehydrogenase PreA subunit
MKYLQGVAQLYYDAELCVGCGRCEEVCPRQVFHVEGDKAIVADIDLCMECGACALNCPSKAIEVRSGVGCATAVLNGRFGIGSSECSCLSDNKTQCC